jgi:hypothetical protein
MLTLLLDDKLFLAPISPNPQVRLVPIAVMSEPSDYAKCC